MPKTKKWIVSLVCAGLLLAACSGNATDIPAVATQIIPALENVLPPDVALNIRNQVSEILGVPVESIQLETVEQTEWPDSCLGLGGPDESCAQAVTPGWLLVFSANGQQYSFRADQTATVIRQEP
ncbi:MAG TPA: hypothetical protein VFQ23_25900 [Anaerolineales bacterium]|nr:hypothetical protein [Anaerolineales bacterium]